MDSIIVNNFDIPTIEKVYEQIRGTIQISAMKGIVIGLAAILLISSFIKEYKARQGDSIEHTDMRRFTDLIYHYVFVIAIIMLLPVLLSFIENALGEMQQHLINGAGTRYASWQQQTKELMEQKMSENPEGPSIMDGLFNWLDGLASMIIAPICFWMTKYLYALFIVGRYFYLIMLEIVSPIAIIMLLNENTRQYFMTWSKHMLVCYLMIPFYIFANNFADIIVNTIFDTHVNVCFVMVSCFVIKLTLFKTVNSRLFNLI